MPEHEHLTNAEQVGLTDVTRRGHHMSEATQADVVEWCEGILGEHARHNPAEQILRKLVDPLGLGGIGPRRDKDGPYLEIAGAWASLTEDEAAWLEAKVAAWDAEEEAKR